MSMQCLTVYRRTLIPPDAQLYQRVLNAGLRAVGKTVGTLTPRFIEGKGESYHVLLDGFFDCHAYPSITPLSIPILSDVRDVLAAAHAEIHVEGDTFAQVAAAVAELLDTECLAILDFPTRQIARCTPETASVLRSDNPGSVFEGDGALGQ